MILDDIYKVNGYGLFAGLSIIPHQDRTTANSLEAPNDVKEAFYIDFEDEDGIEYDLVSPIFLKAREFFIKGHLVVDSIENYTASKMAIEMIIYQNYVTLEMPRLDIKVNAKLKPGIVWRRLTNLNGRIVVEVQIPFSEIMQDIPFKDEGQANITFLLDSQGRYYNTQNNEYLTT